jgi:hypothetical protein
MRRAIIEIDPPSFAAMLRGHDAVMVTSNVPADAVIVGCGWDEHRHLIRLAVESEEFDDVPDGHVAPSFNVIMGTRLPGESERFLAAMELLGHPAP